MTLLTYHKLARDFPAAGCCAHCNVRRGILGVTFFATHTATSVSGAIFVHIVSPLTLCYTVLSTFRGGVTMSGTSCGTRGLRLNSKPRLDTA